MNPAISRPGGETPIRSTSSASTSSKSAEIFRAQVLAVNSRDYTVDVQYESYPYSTHLDIPWMVPYIHQNQGEGISFMPEVGSTVWVCKPSEPDKDAFVLGWTPVQEGGTYRAGRELLNSGDIHLSTRDGNFVTIRRGGIVQIGATPICQRVYIPIRNIIRDLAENYQMSTPAGDLTWEVMREEDQGDGHRGCLYTLACKEYADDPNKDPLAVLKIGSHGEGNASILSLETRNKGGGVVKTSLNITKEGNIAWNVQGNISTTCNGTITIVGNQSISVTSQDEILLKTQSSFTVKSSNAHIIGNNAKLDLDGEASLKGSTVNLGDALYPVVVAHPHFVAWVNAVTALLTGPPSSPAFKGILPPVTMQSTKVRG